VQTGGCSTLLTKRQSLPRQQTRRGLDGGHRTSGGGAPWARAQSEREGEGARLRAQLSGGGRVSVAESRKGSGMSRRGQKTRGRGRVHGGERRRFGGDGSDRRHPSVSENERASALMSGAHGTERASTCARREPTPIGRPHRVARGGERGERARVGWADRRGLPFRGSADARARQRARLRWAELGWLGQIGFFLEFLMAFLFIFSRVSKSNSNQMQIQTISNMCIKQKNNLGSA
jgi:hypothetical protein